MDKPFESELGDIMYPGDPSADPANVYNCRCTIAARVIGFGKTNEAQASDFKTFGSGKTQQVGTLDFENTDNIYEMLSNAEKSVLNLPYEVNYTVTADGKIWRTDGDSAFVDLSSITSSFKGSYSYHNHPKNVTQYSFSGQDVAFFLDSKMQYAKASDYMFEYTLNRTANTVDIDYDTVYNMFRNILDKEVLEMKWFGIIDPDFDEYHAAITILSQRYGFEYERKKVNGNK